MITLLLARHGETALNSEDKLRGWMDIPLNEQGFKEAKVMAQKVKEMPIDRIYCSDLIRAEQTANEVAKIKKLKPITRSWFRPINFGDWNGKEIKAIKDKMQDLLEAWKTNPDTDAPGGESFAEFQDRNVAGLSAVVNAAQDGEMVMIVAHLRNALLFHAIAEVGHPITGDELDLIDDKHFHQESGDVAKYEWDGKLEFKGIV